MEETVNELIMEAPRDDSYHTIQAKQMEDDWQSIVDDALKAGPLEFLAPINPERLRRSEWPASYTNDEQLFKTSKKSLVRLADRQYDLYHYSSDEEKEGLVSISSAMDAADINESSSRPLSRRSLSLSSISELDSKSLFSLATPAQANSLCDHKQVQPLSIAKSVLSSKPSPYTPPDIVESQVSISTETTVEPYLQITTLTPPPESSITASRDSHRARMANTRSTSSEVTKQITSTRSHEQLMKLHSTKLPLNDSDFLTPTSTTSTTMSSKKETNINELGARRNQKNSSKRTGLSSDNWKPPSMLNMYTNILPDTYNEHSQVSTEKPYQISLRRVSRLRIDDPAFADLLAEDMSPKNTLNQAPLEPRPEPASVKHTTTSPFLRKRVHPSLIEPIRRRSKHQTPVVSQIDPNSMLTNTGFGLYHKNVGPQFKTPLS